MAWLEFEFLGDFSAFLQDTRVSKWPRPNTNRIKCDFRMSLGEGTPFPRPGRFISQMFDVPETPNGRQYPVIDMDVSGAFSLHGTSGINIDGRTVDLDIIEHLIADFPGSTKPGIEYHFLFKKVGNDDFNWTWYFESEFPPGTPRDIPMRANSSAPVQGVKEIKDDPQFLDVDWPSNFGQSDFQFFTMSECFDLTAFEAPIGMAEFNGVDAWILLDHGLVNTNTDFIIEARIRLKELDHFWPLMGINGTGGFLGMDGEEFIFGTLRLATSWTPTKDVWFNWRLEFEQPLQLKYKLFIDDIEVMDRTVARQHLQFDTLGVSKQGVPGTIWANMDMRSLKMWTGDFPSSTVAIDMPCETDACDIGPDENHGVTANMTLPSCTP